MFVQCDRNYLKSQNLRETFNLRMLSVFQIPSGHIGEDQFRACAAASHQGAFQIWHCFEELFLAIFIHVGFYPSLIRINLLGQQISSSVRDQVRFELRISCEQ